MKKVFYLLCFISFKVTAQFGVLMPPAISHGTINFSYEAAVQNWQVPSNVTTATISVAGAQGGASLASGGLGAGFVGFESVTPGHIISIAIGGVGGSGGDGGGATWVYDSNTITLLVTSAGGGGGGKLAGKNGGAAGINLTTNAAVNGTGGNGANGTSGNGGTGGTAGTNQAGGGAGAGWLSNGGNGQHGSGGGPGGTGGKDMANGFIAAGTIFGGGGGNGGGGPAFGGGGGGGYNGGGGGNGGDGGGGGGGSYLLGGTANLIGSATATQTGNGSASITW